MSNQNEIKCDESDKLWCCITCCKYFQENKCYFENSKVYCMSCIPEDDDEDDDDICYRQNRGLECSVCYERIIGKREYTGGQYADNDKPLCKVCWELPQHNCFNSCYKNANGKWWCEDDDEDETPECMTAGCENAAAPKDKDSDCWDCQGDNCNNSCRNQRHWNCCDDCFKKDQDDSEDEDEDEEEQDLYAFQKLLEVIKNAKRR